MSSLLRPRTVSLSAVEALNVVFCEPHDMLLSDRIALYGLIRGLKPRAYLEIGVRWGGSARIVATAMQANGIGRGVGLDPNLSSFLPTPRELGGRFEPVLGASPQDTALAVDRLGANPDFVFIDAVHTYSAVKRDLAGVKPFLARGAYVLFHDAYHQGINAAIDEFLSENPDFDDLGFFSRDAVLREPNCYNGLRLIRKGRRTFEEELHDVHERAGRIAPPLDPDAWDRDPFADRLQRLEAARSDEDRN